MQLFTSPYVSYQMYTSLGLFQHRYTLTGVLQIIFPLQRNTCHNYTIYITLNMVNYNIECYAITLCIIIHHMYLLYASPTHSK